MRVREKKGMNEETLEEQYSWQLRGTAEAPEK